MTGKGWPRESARHSLAARGMRTKRATPQHTMTVPTGQKDPLKEPKKEPKPEETLKLVSDELEQCALVEGGSQEDAAELLADEEWLVTHVNELIMGFNLDDGIKTKLVAKIRKRYRADGEADD